MGVVLQHVLYGVVAGCSCEHYNHEQLFSCKVDICAAEFDSDATSCRVLHLAGCCILQYNSSYARAATHKPKRSHCASCLAFNVYMLCFCHVS